MKTVTITITSTRYKFNTNFNIDLYGTGKASKYIIERLCNDM